MGDYYVYTLAYPYGKIFYVGKGRNDRWHSHEREAQDGVQSEKCNIIREIWADGKQVLKRKLYKNLSEEDAFAIEAILIDLFDHANLANEQRGHKDRKLPPRKAIKRRTIGYKHHEYMKNGLYYSDSEPIYEDVFPVVKFS